MSRWKASLPREAPPEGKTQVLLATKSATGSRSELEATVPDDQAQFARTILYMSHEMFLKVANGEEKLIP